MTTFDYVTAWREVAKPAYEALPQNVRDLLGRVTVECGDLSQLADLSMPWPTGELAPAGAESLREAFDKIPAEVLALAAHVIYATGHWHPSGARLVPADGSTWKFAQYADQSLRARLGLPERGDNGRDTATIQIKVIDGAIRLCYSSRDMWTWARVAPATAEGLKRVREAADALRLALNGLKNTSRVHHADNAAYTFFESLKQQSEFQLSGWPGWEAIVNTARFMCTEEEFKRRESAIRPPIDRDAVIARLERERDEAIAKFTRKTTIQTAGKVWLVRRGLPTDNAIYYDHTGRWAFGWYRKLTPEDRSLLLDHLSEFPYDYDIVEPSR